jgi:hypothetical protein
MNSITVRQLQELLEGEDPDALVIFTADYGDYHHTAQALPLRGELDNATIVKSAYSNSGYALDEDGDEGPDGATYVVIR